MEKKEYLFSCTGDFEDLNYLHQLFSINGVDSKMWKIQKDSGKMGLEEILIVLISSEIIPAIICTLKIWLQNRKKEIVIEDKNNGKEIHLISYNGKSFSDSEMENLLSFFKK